MSVNTKVKIAYTAAVGAGGVLAGILFSTQQVSGSFVENKTYIGCDFSDRGEAEKQRSLGLLDKNAIYEACKKAVDNYVEKGQFGEAGKVVIKLHARQHVAELNARRAPTP